MNKTIQFDQGCAHQKEVDLAHCRLTNEEIKKLVGDMTPQELRCVQAAFMAVRKNIKSSQ